MRKLQSWPEQVDDYTACMTFAITTQVATYCGSRVIVGQYKTLEWKKPRVAVETVALIFPVSDLYVYYREKAGHYLIIGNGTKVRLQGSFPKTYVSYDTTVEPLVEGITPPTEIELTDRSLERVIIDTLFTGKGRVDQLNKLLRAVDIAAGKISV